MTDYVHVDSEGNTIPLPVGKVVCVGRNYLKHIQELNNEVPTEPLLFMKPATALCSLNKPVAIPKGMGACHNELEVAVLINASLTHATSQQAEAAIWGVGLGLDLTLRDVQSRLKKQGHPWERAKAFDNSCPISQFVGKQRVDNYTYLNFSLLVDGNLRQSGNTKQMMIPILNLLVEISKSFTLLPGDIVMTGTPEGVGPLSIHEKLVVKLEEHFSVNTYVV